MEKPHHDIKTRTKAPTRPRILEVPTYTKSTQPKTRTVPPESAEPPRALVLTLQILAYAIPLGFLAYVLYINYLPFGYDKTFTIDVGAEGDTTVGEFYLEPSPDLSERKTAADGTTYRELNGMADVVFKPNVVLKDAEITVSVEGEGVSIIPPVTDFNPDDYEWDYEWDFTNPETAFTPKTSERARAEWTSCTTTASTTEMGTGTISEDTEEFVPVPISADNVSAHISATTTEICEQIPVPNLVGNAFFFENELTFNDRDTRLEMPDTADMFEEGPFTVYMEWTPTNNNNNSQQIIGHFNWELFQNRNNVEFRVGRMNNATGTFYSIKYPIKNNEEFFNSFHSAVAIYNPAENGYLELYVDGVFSGRTVIGEDKIWTEYGGQKNLSLGWTSHDYEQSPHFAGVLYTVNFTKDNIVPLQNTANFITTDENHISITLQSKASSTLGIIHIHAIQK